MFASLTDSTIAQYSKPLRLWWQFCKERHDSVLCPSISSVLEFLSFCFSNAGSYSILNTYRSAISLISSDDVGFQPLVKRFFRGVTALKPQQPRYDFIWDPSPVIVHLASLYPHEELFLKLISRKLVTLLVLTTAQRMQTFSQPSNVPISSSRTAWSESRLDLKPRESGNPSPCSSSNYS